LHYENTKKKNAISQSIAYQDGQEIERWDEIEASRGEK
jgi:hypothetical protein